MVPEAAAPADRHLVAAGAEPVVLGLVGLVAHSRRGRRELELVNLQHDIAHTHTHYSHTLEYMSSLRLAEERVS